MIRREVANRELISIQVLVPGNVRMFEKCEREAGDSALYWALTGANTVAVLVRDDF